jgi:hypothetical protein
MKHWPPDRSTMQEPRFRRDSSVFPEADLGKRFQIHPAYIPRPATNGGSRLHLAAVGDEPTARNRRA